MSDFQSGWDYIKDSIVYNSKGEEGTTIKDCNIYFLSTRDEEQLSILYEINENLKRLLLAMEEIVDDEVLESEIDDY